MKLLGLFILLLLGFIILATYLYIVLTGKRLAHLVHSKDRFIWNGLRNVTDKASRSKATIFLDDKNLVISSLSLPGIYAKLKQNNLDEAIIIPFTDIVAFDYDSKSLIPFLRRIINQIFKVNDYVLKISYFGDIGQIVALKFKASSMDPLDFEASFADFNGKIYGNRGLRRGESGEIVPLSQRIAMDTTAPLSPILKEESHDKTVLLREEKTASEPSVIHKDETTFMPRETLASEPSDFFQKISEEPQRVEPPLKPVVFLQPEAEMREETVILPPGTLEEEYFSLRDEDVADSLAVAPLEDNGDKTTTFSTETFSEKTPKKSFFSKKKKSSDKSQPTPSSVVEEPLGDEINRRSFLDRHSVKKEEAPKGRVTAEDKTQILELPEELKRKDTSGFSEDEIKREELERLQKLKEFFSQRNEDRE